ncbi:MAG TPA: hypothetical protein DHV36_14525 [Desulfobacteraceae bacterium]|nr:hypothetical protein [Desulfobacteraceae bacterium]
MPDQCLRTRPGGHAFFHVKAGFDDAADMVDSGDAAERYGRAKPPEPLWASSPLAAPGEVPGRH